MESKKVMEEENVGEYDWVAEHVFSPIYPIIVEQIIHRCGITTGTCLDVGCCGGHLGIAMAEKTSFQVVLMDKLASALQIAEERAAQKGLQSRVRTLQGDVHQIPLPDQSVQLVISRGSEPFWQDRLLAYHEIYRILAPGGMAYIGGGFGSEEQKERIYTIMKKRDPSWAKGREKILSEEKQKMVEAGMRASNIVDYQTIQDESGNWLIFRKPSR